MNLWKRYVTSAGKEWSIEDIPAEDINPHMSRFFMEIKKKDGDLGDNKWFWPTDIITYSYLLVKSMPLEKKIKSNQNKTKQNKTR